MKMDHDTKDRQGSWVALIFAVIAEIRKQLLGEQIEESPSARIVVPDGGRQMQEGSSNEEIETELKRVNLVSQPTRSNLIQNILGHPYMMPSLKELDYYNPSKSAGTLSEHLDKLIESGIVRRLTLPQGSRQRSLPSTFFILSDAGYDLLDRHSLFLPHLDDIREDHARVEKTEKIKRYEQAPRPTADVNYGHPLKGDGMTVVDPTANRNNDNGMLQIEQ